jgi:hypothetical protein
LRYSTGVPVRVSGIVCLASLTPFFFQNTFFHDGTFLFFGFVAIAFASAFFASRRTRYLYLSLASAAYSYFAQPAGIGFVIGYTSVFALFALYDRRQIKHVVAAIAFFLVSLASFSTFQKWSLRHDGSPAVTSQLGRVLFFNEYILGSPYGGFTGVAADELRRRLVDSLEVPHLTKLAHIFRQDLGIRQASIKMFLVSTRAVQLSW